MCTCGDSLFIRWQTPINLIAICVLHRKLTRCATRVDGGDESFAGNTKAKRSPTNPGGSRARRGGRLWKAKRQAAGLGEELIRNDYQLLLSPPRMLVRSSRRSLFAVQQSNMAHLWRAVSAGIHLCIQMLGLSLPT